MKMNMKLRVLPEMVPYDTMARVNGIDRDVCLDSVSRYGEVGVNDGTTNLYSIDDVKPYLRPMSSMTKGEEKVFNDFLNFQAEYVSDADLDNKTDMFNWLNEHHFDYRGLIEKGLALEAPKDMYKTE